MKGLLRRGPMIPPELARRFEPHERTVAVGDGDGFVLVATQLGLWVPAESEDWRRIGWDCIVKATWTTDGLHVVEGVLDGDGVVSDLPPSVFALSAPRNLPVIVRQRVEASIGRWEQVRVPGGTARLVARRTPGRDGLFWTGRLDSGTPFSEAARERVVLHLQTIRAAELARPEG